MSGAHPILDDRGFIAGSARSSQRSRFTNDVEVISVGFLRLMRLWVGLGLWLWYVEIQAVISLFCACCLSQCENRSEMSKLIGGAKHTPGPKAKEDHNLKISEDWPVNLRCQHMSTGLIIFNVH